MLIYLKDNIFLEKHCWIKTYNKIHTSYPNFRHNMRIKFLKFIYSLFVVHESIYYYLDFVPNKRTTACLQIQKKINNNCPLKLIMKIASMFIICCHTQTNTSRKYVLHLPTLLLMIPVGQLWDVRLQYNIQKGLHLS